uniref:hypothetical protein n=1 Tax=Flavobacterium sp. UGB4466 TaxID=2730889 RepID=UPI001ED9256E
MNSVISLVYNRSIQNLIDKLQVLLLKEDGYLKGDAETGSFFINSTIGIFQGTYKTRNNVINIFIEKKPFFISKK